MPWENALDGSENNVDLWRAERWWGKNFLQTTVSWHVFFNHIVEKNKIQFPFSYFPFLN